MSTREMSTSSIEGDDSFDTEEGEMDEDYYYYDDNNGDQDLVFERDEEDPEAFDYCLISKEAAENMLDSLVQETAKKLKVSLRSTYDDMTVNIQRQSRQSTSITNTGLLSLNKVYSFTNSLLCYQIM